MEGEVQDTIGIEKEYRNRAQIDEDNYDACILREAKEYQIKRNYSIIKLIDQINNPIEDNVLPIYKESLKTFVWKNYSKKIKIIKSRRGRKAKIDQIDVSKIQEILLNNKNRHLNLKRRNELYNSTQPLIFISDSTMRNLLVKRLKYRFRKPVFKNA